MFPDQKSIYMQISTEIALCALLNVLHQNCVKLYSKKIRALIFTCKLIKFKTRKIAHTRSILKSFPNFLSTLKHADISFSFREVLPPNPSYIWSFASQSITPAINIYTKSKETLNTLLKQTKAQAQMSFQKAQADTWWAYILSFLEST